MWGESWGIQTQGCIPGQRSLTLEQGLRCTDVSVTVVSALFWCIGIGRKVANATNTFINFCYIFPYKD